MNKILIVENETGIRNSLKRLLERNDYEIIEARSVEDALEHNNLDEFVAVIANLRLPGTPGTALVNASTTPVLLMTEFRSVRTGDETLHMHAVDYISRPVRHDEVLNALESLETNQIKEKKTTELNRQASEQPVKGMVGSCPRMAELFRHIRKVAQTNSSVLIQGESGTGKELVAKALHDASSRAKANLISVNCAAIPENLIESELFGHEKGAFTGATSTRTGLVEAATNGTLFLDEIGELPLDAQARLLRVIQEQEIRKVGSVHSQKVDIRLVAATHRDLKQFVREGLFREDLFYRINVMPLEIPPLRDRGSDILELADLILHRTCERIGSGEKFFNADAMQAITTYPWPGNVRELENAIERAVILSETENIPIELLGLDVELVTIDAANPNISLLETIDNKPEGTDIEDNEDLSLQDYFQRFVLEHQDQMNETELAKKLGISRKCLWERRQRFNIPRKKKNQ